MPGTSPKSDGGICPICGQEYNHQIDVDPQLSNPTVRNDVGVCKQIQFDGEEKWFVHYERVEVVNRVRAWNDQQPERGILGRLLFGGREE